MQIEVSSTISESSLGCDLKGVLAAPAALAPDLHQADGQTGFGVCRDIGECEALWRLFSPNERLFDVWDYRVCFFDRSEHDPYFIVGHDQNRITGILPLILSKKKRQYNYLGGWFPAERNSLYLKDKAKLMEFLEQCPGSTIMEGLDPRENRCNGLTSDENTYYLDLARYNYSFDEYFGSLDKKKQKNLKHDLKNLPEYRVYRNRIEDYGRLIELSMKRYGDESKFSDKAIRKGILKMIKLAHKNGILDMTSVEIGNRVEAVDICVFFKKRYYALIGSSNCQRIPNLGKLMTVLNIRSAIEKGARYVEFGATADHWKSMWKFDKEMLLKFEK